MHFCRKYASWICVISMRNEDWEIPFESLTDLEYVGAGAFGKVYSAKLNDEIVAVKIPEDKKEINMKYLRELRHENIVRFRGVCNNTTNPCLIMEFCQYGSLYNFLHSGARIMINVTLKWAKEIALAMGYLHSRNIIHRDLKSPNILIADNLVVKISDFGTSRKWEKYSFIMTTRGTTYWMAPEMMLGKKCSDRVDVWSYGVVLWELLTQEVPYENLHPCAVTYGVGRETISLPLPSTFPLHLRILMNHCWNRDPKCRPSFNRISEVLNLAADQWSWLGDELFMTMQDAWRQEVRACKKNGWHAVPREQVQLIEPQKENRLLYRKIMREASKMYLDACSLYLRLEQREVAITERELAYNGLVNHRSLFNNRSRSHSARRSSSSSSSTNRRRQMTIVKVHDLNRKPRTITELASAAAINSDGTKSKGAIPKTTVIKSTSPKIAVIKTAVKKTADTSVTINSKTGVAETIVVNSENNTHGIETVIKVDGPMNGRITNYPKIHINRVNPCGTSEINTSDTEKVINKTVVNDTATVDASLNKIKKTADVVVIKPFGAKTTMRDASTIKIYGTKPGLNKTPMINVSDKVFTTDATFAKLVGTRTPMTDSTTKLAEAKTAMTDASKVKMAFAGSAMNHGGDAAKTESVKIKKVKAPLSDSSMMKLTGNNMPDLLNSMSASFPIIKANKVKPVRQVSITKFDNDMDSSLIKNGAMTESIINSLSTKYIGNKPVSVIKANEAMTESMTKGKLVETEINPAPNDDFNGNFNKIFKSTIIICDDKINDNVLNEPVQV